MFGIRSVESAAHSCVPHCFQSMEATAHSYLVNCFHLSHVPQTFFEAFYPPSANRTFTIIGPNTATNPGIEASLDVEYCTLPHCTA